MVLDRSFPARERCGKLALSLVASFAVLAPIAESPAQHIEDGRLVYPERRVAAATAGAIQAALGPFSLRDAGSLGQGQSITTPLLVINGTLDGLVPVSDLTLTHESAVDSDLWLLGRGDHCAIEYWPVVIPQLADWLIEKISR